MKYSRGDKNPSGRKPREGRGSNRNGFVNQEIKKKKKASTKKGGV